ncbi:MAG TPA: DUF1569 domain-containing protein [Vicinamibacterales bacterium]|nr:DUF1569 domain-containing protein [Vicinamibacterales bacterium]
MHRTLERCRADLRAARAGLTPAEAEGTSSGRWSAAGILEHLDLSYTGTTRAIERCLAKGRPLDRSPLTLRQRVGRLLLLRLGGLFYRSREAPAAIVPKGRRFRELDAVLEPHLLVLDQRLKQAARAFGRRAPVARHPFLGPCSVDDWRRFHRWHTRHHLKQVRNQKSEARNGFTSA